MEKKLPTLAELVSDLEGYQKADQFNYLLNQEPPATWIKKHPIIKKDVGGRKVPLEYLPIDKVEYLLRRIFKRYKIEILSISQVFNSVVVVVRLHYLDPTTGEWLYHDGTGASNIQLNKDANPGDLAQIKQSAVMMAAPLAKTLAIKDAAEMFGSLFGANLNRQDVNKATLDPGVKKAIEAKHTTSLDTLKNYLDKCDSTEEVELVENNYLEALANGQVDLEATSLITNAYNKFNNHKN